MSEELPKTEFAFVSDVRWVNQKPHPFVIGTRHVAHASDHNGGILDESVISQFPCADKDCRLPYNQHTKGDHVAFVRLTREVTTDEMRTWLLSLKEWCDTNKIDGFAFIDTGFRISK